MTTHISDQKYLSREAQHTQASSKDAASFEHIYRHYQPVLGSYLARSTGNRELAKDLTQEIFVKAWQVWSTAQQPKHLKGWLYRVAKNASIEEYRRGTHNGRVTMHSLQELQEDLKDETALSNQEQDYGTRETRQSHPGTHESSGPPDLVPCPPRWQFLPGDQRACLT